MTEASGRSDAELAASAAAGGRAAFAEIYDRYADHIFDLCASVLRDRTDAADAMQETFLLAAQRLAQLREPTKLRAWLFAIARHEALRLIRARSRVRPTEEVGELPEPAGDPSRPAEEEELRQVVQDAAAGLDARDRTVLELHLRRGIEGRELADVLGVSENHAWVIMHRVRQRFDRALGALLVARRGCRDCPQLQQLLAGWDGRFSPLLRKRVARHVDQCATCADTRARVASPAALLARVPLVPAPLALREQVLGDIDLVGHTAALPRGWRDGFPPAMYPQRRRRVGAVAAVAVLLVIGGLGWYGAQWFDDVGGSGGGRPVAAETGTPGPAPDRPDRPVRPADPAATPSAEPGASPPDPTTAPSPSPRTSPLPAFPPASIGQVTADPAGIQQEDGFCQSLPTISEVSVEVTEHNVLSFVYLHWSVAGEEGRTGSMVRAATGSNVRRAEIGPFDEDSVPDGGSEQVELHIEIIDTYGQTVTHPLPEGTLTLHDCSPI